MANSSSNDLLLQIHLMEYQKLKDEQISRIQFRDNMIFVMLGAVGGIVSFVLTNPQHSYGLLVIPWVCIVLGWTYINNDRAISEIGKYLRNDLAPKLQQITSTTTTPNAVLDWEVEHRQDRHRRQRKNIQLVIDLLTFCASGVVALVWLLFTQQSYNVPVSLLMVAEIALLLILCLLFLRHSDRSVGRASP